MLKAISKLALSFLITAILLSFTSKCATAQFLYSLVDTSRDIDVTYRSPVLIVPNLDHVSATTSNTMYNILSFDAPYIPGGGPDAPHGIEIDRLSVGNSSVSSYYYNFPLTTFGSLGTYNTSTVGESDYGVLTITDVPEPVNRGWLYLLLLAVFYVSRKAVKKGKGNRQN